MKLLKKDMLLAGLKQHVIVITGALFFFFSVANGYASPLEIANQSLPSVVTVVVLDDNGRPLSYGSGFFLNRSGDIVTSHHVLEGCARARVITQGGVEGKILGIVKNDPRLDLVVARTSLRNTPPLVLGDGRHLAPGDRVLCLGNGNGSGAKVAKGVIHGVREAAGIRLIQISAVVTEGSSGGPVLDAGGAVIGVAMAFLSQGKDLNFAIPADYLKTLKSVNFTLQDLPRATTRFEAALSDGELTELFLTPKRGPGTVYFRNGRTLQCDRAWKDSNTIFLVVHGKDVAIGYEETGIDMDRSFVTSP